MSDSNHPQNRWGGMGNQQSQPNPYAPINPVENSQNGSPYENQPQQTYNPNNLTEEQYIQAVYNQGQQYPIQYPTQYPPQNSYNYQPNYYPNYYIPDPNRGLAVTSMVLGLCGIFFGIFTAIPAIIMGQIAIQRRTTARGMALTGLISGYIVILFWVVELVSILVTVASGQ